MCAAVFDYNDNDFIMPFDNKMGMDSKGNLMRRLCSYGYELRQISLYVALAGR